MEIINEQQAVDILLNKYHLEERDAVNIYSGALIRFAIGMENHLPITPIVIEPSSLNDRICGGHVGIANYLGYRQSFFGGNCNIKNHALFFDPTDNRHDTIWTHNLTIQLFNEAKINKGIVVCPPGYYPDNSSR